MSANIQRYVDLDLDNPAPRCPVILLLDVSASMAGEPIEELNRGLQQFIEETSHDEAASRSVELEIITFGNWNPEVILPFTPICDIQGQVKKLKAFGSTPMGEALSMATQHLEERRKLYRKNGISCYRPWVILMTDGEPNDEWKVPAKKMRQYGEQGKIQYIGIEIGDEADHEIMRLILPPEPGPLKLHGLRFKQFFRWLTDSLNSVSRSAVSEQDEVNYRPVDDWADL